MQSWMHTFFYIGGCYFCFVSVLKTIQTHQNLVYYSMKYIKFELVRVDGKTLGE